MKKIKNVKKGLKIVFGVMKWNSNRANRFMFSWSTKYNFQIMLAISSRFCVYDELPTYSRNNMIKIDQFTLAKTEMIQMLVVQKQLPGFWFFQLPIIYFMWNPLLPLPHIFWVYYFSLSQCELLCLLGRMNYIDDNCIVKFDGKWHTVWYMQYIVLVSLLKSHVYWLVELYVVGQGNFQWRRGDSCRNIMK